MFFSLSRSSSRIVFPLFPAIPETFSITKYRGYNSSTNCAYLKTSWFLGSSSAPRLCTENPWQGGPPARRNNSPRCILQIFKALPSNISFISAVNAG